MDKFKAMVKYHEGSVLPWEAQVWTRCGLYLEWSGSYATKKQAVWEATDVAWKASQMRPGEDWDIRWGVRPYGYSVYDEYAAYWE